MEICVIGTGYVGLVTGTCLAEVGHRVICVDVDKEKIARLSKGESVIFEPGLDRVIERNLDDERLIFTDRLDVGLADAKIVFVAVGTPEGEDGSADLSYVEAVARSIGQKAAHHMAVVVKSTVPVGTCDRVEAILGEELKKRKVGFTLPVSSNPEFLKEGAAIDDFMKPERIIVGIKDKSDRAVFEELYRPFIIDDPGRLMFMRRRSSELTKYGSNAMLATRVSFMNQLSQLCETVGADIDEIRRGMGSDSRIGKKFLYAGPGYGGSCFPKDVEALIHSGDGHGVDFTILKEVRSANQRQKEYAVKKVEKFFGGNIAGKKVAVWGLSFKPGTDDVRESPSLTIVKELIGKGAAVSAHDPVAIDAFARAYGDSPSLQYAGDAYEAAKGASALILVTEWREYRRPNWTRIKELMVDGGGIFDYRNQYTWQGFGEMGLTYEGMGKANSMMKGHTLDSSD